MKKLNILDLSKEELSEIIKPSFRAKQIYQWIYQKYVNSFDEMKNIPKELKEELNQNFFLDPLSIIKIEQSLDGSKKYLFALKDGQTVESVLLPMKQEKVDEEGKLVHHTKYTICISSQVGCKIGCAFCLTGKDGFKRNLSAGEITASFSNF